MAEVAAGALVAEQVIATTVEGAALTGYAVSKPTMPLKASFTQIATAPKDDSEFTLARSHHTLNVMGHKAYIFGGEVGPGKLASNHFHTVTLPSSDKNIDSEYSCLPAVSSDDDDDNVPCPRTKHAACTQGHELAIFGGCDESGNTVDQDSCIWIWNTNTHQWSKITASPEDPVPQPRFSHKLFSYGGHLILHGGQSTTTTLLTDTWFFDLTARMWRQLPDAPVHSNSVALVDGTLYSMAKTRTEGHCHVHVLSIAGHVPSPSGPEGLEWHEVPLPSEKPTSTPDVRAGAGLLPISTGYGRQYLAYIFGYDDAESESPDYYADFWTYQVGSKSTRPASWTDFKPAALKDAIRHALGKDTGGQEWAEVEVEATEQVAHEGKVHPGPRAYFGCDVGEDGRSLVLWGGVNPRGEKEADGWLIQLH